MNDLKTAERSRLGTSLKDLMIWHTMGKQLSCEQVPVAPILREFRALAGVRGRNAHRGQAPPQYDHREVITIQDE